MKFDVTSGGKYKHIWLGPLGLHWEIGNFLRSHETDWSWTWFKEKMHAW